MLSETQTPNSPSRKSSRQLVKKHAVGEVQSILLAQTDQPPLLLQEYQLAFIEETQQPVILQVFARTADDLEFYDKETRFAIEIISQQPTTLLPSEREWLQFAQKVAQATLFETLDQTFGTTAERFAAAYCERVNRSATDIPTLLVEHFSIEASQAAKVLGDIFLRVDEKVLPAPSTIAFTHWQASRHELLQKTYFSEWDVPRRYVIASCFEIAEDVKIVAQLVIAPSVSASPDTLTLSTYAYQLTIVSALRSKQVFYGRPFRSYITNTLSLRFNSGTPPVSLIAKNQNGSEIPGKLTSFGIRQSGYFESWQTVVVSGEAGTRYAVTLGGDGYEDKKL